MSHRDSFGSHIMYKINEIILIENAKIFNINFYCLFLPFELLNLIRLKVKHDDSTS